MLHYTIHVVSKQSIRFRFGFCLRHCGQAALSIKIVGLRIRKEVIGGDYAR